MSCRIWNFLGSERSSARKCRKWLVTICLFRRWEDLVSVLFFLEVERNAGDSASGLGERGGGSWTAVGGGKDEGRGMEFASPIHRLIHKGPAGTRYFRRRAVWIAVVGRLASFRPRRIACEGGVGP